MCSCATAVARSASTTADSSRARGLRGPAPRRHARLPVRGLDRHGVGRRGRLRDYCRLAGLAVARSAAGRGFHRARGSLYETLSRATGFAVNLVSGDRADLAEDFARKGVRSFSGRDGLRFRRSPSGYPLLEGSVGWLDCRVHAKHVVGDHTLFVGKVLTVEVGRPEIPRLPAARLQARLA